MTDDHKLMIGLPVFNSEKYLEPTINSIRNQTLKSWRCIIIDDGSSDLSMELAHELTQRDERFTILSDGLNRGLPARLNELTSLSECEYIARMDSDDIMFPDRLEYQLKYLDDHPDVDVIGGSGYSIDSNNRVVGRRKSIPMRKQSGKFELSDAIGASLYLHPSIMGRTQWFRQYPYSEINPRSEDYELWIRSVRGSRLEYIDHPIIFIREFGLSSARKYDQTMLELSKLLRSSDLNEDPVYSHLIKDKLRDVEVKRVVYRIASLLKLEESIIGRRTENVSSIDLNSVQVILNQVIQR